MKKAFTLIIAVTFISVLICSCGSKNAYRNDVACSDIIAVLEEQIATEGGYAHYESDELKLVFGDDISLATDCALSYSLLSQNIDEFGIFKADSEKNAYEIAEECIDYIEEKYEDENAFIASYAPEELPKLRDGEVKVFGNYVAFAILDQNSRAALFEKVEKMLIAEG
ncbi:MAG: DUF4358 domain-containing protein [Ruminococcaceae bacterium]|nr:DUF4358 domain-containing protein [Oscillospiraceae bacterium]